jgi:hypothetical protein
LKRFLILEELDGEGMSKKTKLPNEPSDAEVKTAIEQFIAEQAAKPMFEMKAIGGTIYGDWENYKLIGHGGSLTSPLLSAPADILEIENK